MTKKRPGTTSQKKKKKKKKGTASKKSTTRSRAAAKAKSSRPAEKRLSNCLVVGIGASAGGLDSFKRFLQAMPHDSGMAFVLIQHLDPNHASMMANLLSKYTAMQVVEAEDAMPIEPNHVYMIPPNKFIKIADGGLFLDKPIHERGKRTPVDYFFRSLATEREQRAVGIVLSGTGSDGSQGVKEIKAAGGMSLAQKPETAEYPGMPQAAIGTGMVDFVLPIEDMPKVLTNYAEHPYIDTEESKGFLEDSPDHFKAIIHLLRAHTDYDFRSYKKGTLGRRIQRRMGLRHVRSIDAYVKLLRSEPGEVRKLFKDCLIGVTRFFRDREAWETLEDDVVRPLVASKRQNETVRIWVPGCATGEEAYSLAILFFEAVERERKNLDLQIFATDLDEDAIVYARNAIYPGSIASDVRPERLARFFREHDDRYLVNKRLRESVVFAIQNLISDPPFSNLDIISCRNVLIYLESEIQHKLMEMFHFALSTSGYLFLGSSESVAKRARLFKPVSKNWRIFQAVSVKREAGKSHFPILRTYASRGRAVAPDRIEATDGLDVARRALLEEFAPPTVLINADFEIQYYHGRVRDYLDFPDGEATSDLLALATRELRSKVRAVVTKAMNDREKSEVMAPRVTRGEDSVAVRITARPVPASRDAERTFLVSFEDRAPSPAKETKTKQDTEARGPRADASQTSTGEGDVEQLEFELQAVREDLQSTIEELETSNEELKSSNEEVMSMNEELQSSNEELETSREELQSLNEELNTVNNQLEEKVRELELTNNDLINLLSSTDVATIFLDTDLCIRRFTDAALELLHVRASDEGRPISDLAPRVSDPDLINDARVVLQKLQPVEKEVRNGDGRWFVRRILPYRTTENKIEGIVITFTDISLVKETSSRIAIRERQQATIARLGLEALSLKSLKPFLDRVAREMAKTLSVPLVKVLRKLDDNEGLRLEAGVGWKRGLVGKALVPVGPGSQAGYSLNAGVPVVVANLSEENRFSGPELLLDHAVVSGMSVIIGPSEQPWGVLGAHATEVRRFEAEDVNFLQAVANLVYSAVENLRAKSELEAEARRAALVREAVVLSASAEKLDEALEACIDIVCRLTGWKAGHAFVVDEDGTLEPTGSWRLPGDGSLGELKRITEKTTFRVGDKSLPGKTAATNRVEWFTNVHETRGFKRASGRPSLPVKGAIAFPVTVGGGVVAVAEFFDKDEIDPDEGLVAVLLVLAEQLSRIFERHFADEAKRRGQERLEMIVEAADVAVWEWNLRTDKSTWNDQMYHLLGIDTSAEATGETFFRAIHEDDRKRLEEVLQGVAERGKTYDHEFRVVHPDGTVRWLSGRGRVVRDGNHRPFLMRGVNLDITRQKQAEEDLKRMNETLEQRVSERGAVAEQRAELLRGMALQITDAENRERQRIARLLHDDLQQLLTALGMRLSKRAKSGYERDKEIKESRRLLDLALKRCRSLASDLNPPAVRDGDLAGVVRWVARRFEEHHGLNVSLELSDEHVEVDPEVSTVVYRILQETLFNVVKHAGVDEASVRVGRNESLAEILIEDQGRGFEPSSSTEPNAGGGGGTGYGLLSIRERARSIAGTFEIESSPSKGTRARLTLPVRPSATKPGGASDTAGRPASAPERSRVASRGNGRVRVLVADDNEIMRSSVVELLEEDDELEVVATASNGEEAVTLTRQHLPDVVVMDVNMPKTNGIEATRQIKNEFADVAVVGLSMYDEALEKTMRGAGADEFVGKEVVSDRLIKTLRACTGLPPQ